MLQWRTHSSIYTSKRSQVWWYFLCATGQPSLSYGGPTFQPNPSIFHTITHDDYFSLNWQHFLWLILDIISITCIYCLLLSYYHAGTNPLYAYNLIWVRLISARDAWITSCFPCYLSEAAFTKFSFFSDWRKATASPKFKQDGSKPALQRAGGTGCKFPGANQCRQKSNYSLITSLSPVWLLIFGLTSLHCFCR